MQDVVPPPIIRLSDYCELCGPHEACIIIRPNNAISEFTPDVFLRLGMQLLKCMK